LSGDDDVKKFFISVLAVVALLVATALVAPSFIDWNAYRGEIAAEVKKATGRAIFIDGRIDVALLPAPKLSLTKARLANLEGAASPDMVRLEALDLRISPWPLFSGRVVVQSVVLKGADIRLEHLADGRQNWQFEKKKRPGSRGSGSRGGARKAMGSDRVRLEQVVIENSALTYRDSRTGKEKSIRQFNARIAAATLSGPFRARGKFRLGGVPLGFELRTGRVETFASTKLVMELEVPSAKAKVMYSGYVTPGRPSVTFAGKVASSGPDLAKLVSALARAGGGRVANQRVIAQPFSFSAALKGGAEALTATEVKIEINGTRASGSINAILGKTTDVDAVVKVNRLDLDQWLAKAGKPRGGQAKKPRAKAKKPKFSLPKGLNLALDADIGGFIYNKGVVRDIKFRGRLEKGKAQLTRLSARLPGGSDATLSGRLTARRGAPRFDGQVSLNSGDFRALVRWLGGDDSAIPPDRLRKLRYRSSIGLGLGAQPKQIDLRDMDLRFDASHVTGAMVVALRERMGIGARLNVDRLNLDAYMPQAGAKSQAKGAGARKGPSGGKARPGAAGGRALLGLYDANLDLSAGRLTYNGEQARGLRLVGTLYQGDLKLDKLSLTDFAGARVEAKGTIKSIDRTPVPNLDLALSAKNPRRLFAFAALPIPLTPEKLAPFALKGNVKSKDNATRLDFKLSAGRLALSAKGALADLATVPRTALEVDLGHPDFVTFIRLFDPKFKPEKPVKGPLRLAAQIIGKGLDFKLDRFDARLGTARLKGVATLSLAGLRPRLKGDLEGDTIIVDHFLNAPADGVKTGRRGRNSPRQRDTNPWSDEPLDLGVLRLIDADFRIRAKSIAWRRWQVADPRLDLTLEDGRLDMRRLTGRMVGGRFHMTGRLAAPSKPGDPVTTRFDVDASRVDLRQAMFNAADIDVAKGIVDFKMALSGGGVSSRAIARSLAGSGSLLATNGEVKGFDLARVNKSITEMSDAVSLLSLLRSAMSGGTTRFSRLTGTYKVTGGVLRSDDIALDADGGTGTGRLMVDIGRWWMEGRTKFRLSGNRDAPPFGLRLKGPLDKPKRKIEAGRLQAWLGKRAADALAKQFLNRSGRSTGTSGGTSGGTAPQPSTRDKFIEGIFDILKK
jgi:uncharacterized protein involved in outer membrane biogenesis